MQNWRAWVFLIAVNVAFAFIATAIMQASMMMGVGFLLLVACPILYALIVKMRAQLMGAERTIDD